MSSLKWPAGLAKVVEYTKNMDLQGEEGLVLLGCIITGIHTLLEHPHNQVHAVTHDNRSES